MRKLIVFTALGMVLAACSGNSDTIPYSVPPDQVGTYNAGTQTVCGAVNAGKCINLHQCIANSANPPGAFLNTTPPSDYACVNNPGASFPCPGNGYVLSCFVANSYLYVSSGGQFISSYFQ